MSEEQLSNLPKLTKFVTSHNRAARAVVHSHTDFAWQHLDEDKMAFSVVYSTSSFPAVLSDDADIISHDKLIAKGTALVNPNGTILRYVDFAPGYTCAMHRTKSLDYGIVLEGELEMILDSGEIGVMKRGDVAIQRAAMHSWRNRSKTEWARMIFVLQDCETPIVAGKPMIEDLGRALEFLPSWGI